MAGTRACPDDDRVLHPCGEVASDVPSAAARVQTACSRALRGLPLQQPVAGARRRGGEGGDAEQADTCPCDDCDRDDPGRARLRRALARDAALRERTLAPARELATRSRSRRARAYARARRGRTGCLVIARSDRSHALPSAAPNRARPARIRRACATRLSRRSGRTPTARCRPCDLWVDDPLLARPRCRILARHRRLSLARFRTSQGCSW